MYARTLLRGCAAAALAVAVPATLNAQDPDPEGWQPEPVVTPTFDLEARGGVAFPVADLKEYADPGGTAGLGAALWLNDHVALRLDGDVVVFDGKVLEAEPDTPDMNLWHFGAGVEFDVVGRADTETWTLEANAGAGGTVVDTNAFGNTDGGVVDDVTQTFPNVNAGFEVGRQVGEDFLITVGSQLFYTFLDDDELEGLSSLRPLETLDDGISIPLTLSIRWDLPMTM